MRALPILAAALLLAGAARAETPVAVDAPAAPGVITSQAVPGGTVYADIEGDTLYTFDHDKPGKSACDRACAETWHPLPTAWIAAPMGDWTIVTREDGGRQWAFKGNPLYTFAGDHHAGETNGDGADKAWHAVMTERKFLPPKVVIWHSDFGPAFATADGRTLYVLAELRFNPLGTKRHTGANLGLTECTGNCLADWPPLVAPPDAKDAEDWSVVTRADGVRQWAYKGWPVYMNAQDAKPGDALGEGVTVVRNGLSGLSWQVATL
jgi:predicted lipoprotein with Yx(FWY)xxD motif